MPAKKPKEATSSVDAKVKEIGKRKKFDPDKDGEPVVLNKDQKTAYIKQIKAVTKLRKNRDDFNSNLGKVLVSADIKALKKAGVFGSWLKDSGLGIGKSQANNIERLYRNFGDHLPRVLHIPMRKLMVACAGGDEHIGNQEDRALRCLEIEDKFHSINNLKELKAEFLGAPYEHVEPPEPQKVGLFEIKPSKDGKKVTVAWADGKKDADLLKELEKILSQHHLAVAEAPGSEGDEEEETSNALDVTQEPAA